METGVPEGIEKAGPAFRFCPSCGGRRIGFADGRKWSCPDCGFLYFHNVAASAGVVAEREGAVLLLRRAKEPRRGFLALPGGFVDPGESAEDCALRECVEEIGWKPEGLKFLASFPNLYVYEGVPYATCDVFFGARLDGFAEAALAPDPGEVSEIVLAPLGKLPWNEIAFGSARKALELYLQAGGTLAG